VKLTQQEISEFYKIWCALIWGVNEKHSIVPKFEKPVYSQNMKQEPFVTIRSALWSHPEWIDDFILNNEYSDLTEVDLGVLTDWRKNFVRGRFIIMRHLKKYSVLMTFDEPTKLYGVCGITDPICDLVPNSALPIMIETTLLPFKDKIIYDSLLSAFSISFGGGYRSSFKDSYNEAKSKVGIIENMFLSAEPIAPIQKKPKVAKPAPPVVDTKGANVPKAMSARYMEVVEILESFCDEKLNAEYKQLCLKALAKLCRKRPSPIATGKARTWACGIVYAIGSNNFIFDKSQPINLTAGDIADWFGLSKSTSGSKGKEVSKLLSISYLNHEYLLNDILKDSPMVWMLSVNGYYVDIRTMPRDIQEAAYNKGLIPYIPADRRE
jgi:hypothetical protein